MTKTLLFFILLSSFKSFSQQRTVYKYWFNSEEIEYSKIDYSQFGIMHFYVTAFESNESNKCIEINATNFLKKFDNLYHTFYFFIAIPAKFNFEQKEAVFNQIMKEIENREKEKVFNLNLNFDIDYSNKYQSEKIENNLINQVNRIFTGITPKNIKNGLF